jgi:hypothetical protein
MMAKRILCSDRLRRIPSQFSWIDHRFVRDKHICGISHSSLALYLFLLTVSDVDGLSYYSAEAIHNYLGMDVCMISQLRAELCAADLIAYRNPFYQVLSLDEVYAVEPAASSLSSTHRTKSEPTSFGDIMRQALGGK